MYRRLAAGPRVLRLVEPGVEKPPDSCDLFVWGFGHDFTS